MPDAHAAARTWLADTYEAAGRRCAGPDAWHAGMARPADPSDRPCGDCLADTALAGIEVDAVELLPTVSGAYYIEVNGGTHVQVADGQDGDSS